MSLQALRSCFTERFVEADGSFLEAPRPLRFGGASFLRVPYVVGFKWTLQGHRSLFCGSNLRSCSTLAGRFSRDTKGTHPRVKNDEPPTCWTKQNGIDSAPRGVIKIDSGRASVKLIGPIGSHWGIPGPDRFI